MTALMQLIREIEVLKHESENTRDYFKEQGMEIASIGSGGLVVAYRACIEKATSLLPVEKEQRINDILAGMKFFGVDITAPANIAIAEKIHNQNFTQ